MISASYKKKTQQICDQKKDKRGQTYYWIRIDYKRK